jgi:hypothetical protein
VTMSEPGGTDQADASALLERLRLIEDQPLDTRAASYSQINDSLQATLEGGDTPR